MKTGVLTGILVGSVLLAGCVSSGTHSQAITELEEARRAAAQTASDFDKFKRQAEAEAQSLRQETAALREDKQRLMGGSTTAQAEIARLQKRAGELETEVARIADLQKRLSERDQEIGRLRPAAAERETLTGRVAVLTDELEKTKQRVAALTGDLAALSDEAARTRQERDRLSGEVQKLQGRLEDVERARAGIKERSKAAEAEKARLEQERAAKEAEIQRLTRTHAELTKSLEAEIAKGDIRIQQVRDRLTINMVDRVLFDSGQAQVKPSGLKVLKQVSDILKNVTDKQIRIEGHTDNVPIGIKLRERFPTNWELSTTRATTVVRLLIEEGGVPRENLSAVGYADTRPVAGNDTEIGRTANRRIEIVLFPKDLSEIAGQTKP